MKTTHKSLQMSQYTQIYQSCKSNQLNVTLFFKTLRTFVEAIIQVLRIQPDVVSFLLNNFKIDLKHDYNFFVDIKILSRLLCVSY